MAITYRAFSVLLAKESGVTDKESGMSRYGRILDEYHGTEALRRILELDGNAGRCLDSCVSRYAARPEPLRAYAVY